MKVLSLFDGVSSGRQVLKQLSYPVELYVSSEVDKNAMNISRMNHNGICYVGDVKKYTPEISFDLILGGSPCQGFSYAGKGLNFNDPRSSLFFEYVRILNQVREINPDVKFLLENVTMQQCWQEIISEQLGVSPVKIDADKYSPVRRNRLYWINWSIPDGVIPVSPMGGFYNLTGGKPCSIVGRRLDSLGRRKDNEKDLPITQCIEVVKADIGRCITTVSKDSCVYFGEGSGRLLDAYGTLKGQWRPLSIEELEFSHGYPKGYFHGVSEAEARKAMGNGWSLAVIKQLLTYSGL